MHAIRNGFTLIELLVVISIIGVLSTIAMTSLNGARAKARDVRRLSDMEQIRTALELYKIDHGEYPEENSSGPYGGDWEMSYEDGGAFIEVLKTEGYFPNGTPLDPVNANGKYYYYYVYPATNGGCPMANGEFYVLGVKDMESSRNPHPSSPGWSCATNWQNSFDWVTGSFEKG